MTPTPARPKERGGVFRESLHVLVLAGFAVAQPVYDLLARQAGFFVVRRSEGADVLVLAGALSLLLPAGLAAVLAVWRRIHPRTGLLGHRLVVAALVAAFALQVLKRLGTLPGRPAVALALAAGAAAAVAYHRLAAARLFLSLLAPAIVLFPTLFLFQPSILKILRPPHVEAIADLEMASRPPIVFIVFDALPLTSLMNVAGEIDPVRFPSFAGLAGTATWYRNATTVSGDTIYAVPAILTGNYPDLERQPSFVDHPRNLFTLLGPSFELELFEHLTDLCPPQLCARTVSPAAARLRHLAADLAVVFPHLLLPPDLTASLPQISQAWADFAVGETKPGRRNRNRKYALFLKAIDARRPATLYFLHSLFPHAPYQYMPSGKRYTRQRDDLDPQVLLQGRWSSDEWAVRESFKRHLLQVGMVDALVGHVLERLRELELFDRSLIVVTADHGVSFRPGDSRRNVTATNFLDVMPVPLLIKRPQQTRGEIDDRNVESIDILPTIADLLGVDLPWKTDGVSAAGDAGPRRGAKICYGGGRLELPAAAFDAKGKTVARMSAAFSSGDFSAVLRAGPHAELVGRELEQLAVIDGDSDVSTWLADPSLFLRVDPGSDFVPALIEGFVELEREAEPPVELAIAVDGVVAAVTRSHLEPLGKGRYAFSALAAEDVFRSGVNEVEVLRIQETEHGLRLAHTGRGVRRALYAGVRLGAAEVRGIEEAGFHETETISGETLRWTDGAARLVVPVDAGAPPGSLRLALALTGKPGNELTVAVNQRTLFHGKLPPEVWSRTFDLSGVAFGREAVIEVTSGSFVPAEVSGSLDRRTLGVAVSGIWLDGY